jgi:O-antigen ligase
MSEAAPAARDGLGVWCGWVLTAAAVLTPLFAWLGPLGFAPLVGVAGLLCLPAFRVSLREAPLLVILAVAAAWAAMSGLWSPHRPDELEDSTALKIALQVPLYWAAWCAARRVAPDYRRRVLLIFAWGLGLFGMLLLVEAFTGAAIYQGLRNAIGDPIRPDLARKNVAQGSFVLALLWPVALAGGMRAGAPIWLALPMAAGTALLASHFLSDAPTLAVGLAILAAGLTLVWPRSAPKAFGVGAALLIVAMPLAILAIRMLGMGQHLPVSWAQRVGYWTYALERIAEKPWTGWGLDASRAFSPHIQLHPHNGPLQLWLELGLLGAILAALAWVFAFRRLARDERSFVAAGTAASAAVYVFFGAISFGVWQEWWLALGALVAVIAALGDGEDAATVKPIDAPARVE